MMTEKPLAFKPLTTGHAEYAYVEQLLHSAFPPEERRDDDRQRINTDKESRFYTLYIYRDGDKPLPVGVLTYWDFDSFLYIEHLAIDPSLRGQGYGQTVLASFGQSRPHPIVLEVEHPTDEQSRRRIRFYQQCGFTLWPCDYLQPPYRKGDSPLPLYLMASGGLDFHHHYDTVRKTLHREVYGQKFG